jgi:antitoxin component YwqK of YwqJK toxin-antitoxin module
VSGLNHTLAKGAIPKGIHEFESHRLRHLKARFGGLFLFLLSYNKFMSKNRTEVSLIEKNGRTFSKRIVYYENGQIAESGLYTNSQGEWSWNIPIGTVLEFYESGEKKSEISYDENGSLDGESHFYNFKGELILRKTYSQDRLLNEESFEEETSTKPRVKS